MILVIDNYDSFIYNIVDYLGRITNEEVKVVRNDKISIKDILGMNISKIIISPGPKSPKNAGISIDIVKTYSGKIPILGVCLGHQVICEAFGGQTVKAKKMMHGKTSKIQHKKSILFKGVNESFIAMRYHSLVTEKNCLPNSLKITAYSLDDDEIMAVEHNVFAVFGLQFHPEALSTESGLTMLNNFINLSKNNEELKCKN